MIFISDSQNRTGEIAKEFAKRLKCGDCVCLEGDLGAGKTVFAKGVASALGVKEVVKSPSFNILLSYDSGKIALNHFDAYRVDSVEAFECGFEEYIYEDNAIALIEWAQNIKELLPKKYYEVKITKKGENLREIEINEVCAN